jgi:trans-aconitate methyltransferase
VTAAPYRALAKDAAARYPARDRFARHFAFGKLTRDPVFRHLIESGAIPRGARLVDLGCGQGVLAALLAAARERHARGEWPAQWPAPPDPASMLGIDLSARNIARARSARIDGATFEQGDIREARVPQAEAIAILDVLHYVDEASQALVFARVRDALALGGVLLLRVGDRSGAWRFRYTDAVDRFVTWLRTGRREPVHTRPAAQWRALLEELGFHVEQRPMSKGTLFANVLLVARYHSR